MRGCKRLGCKKSGWKHGRGEKKRGEGNLLRHFSAERGGRLHVPFAERGKEEVGTYMPFRMQERKDGKGKRRECTRWS